MDVETKLTEGDLDSLGAFILRREKEFRQTRVRRVALRACVVLAASTVALFVFQGQGAPEAAARVVISFTVLLGIYLTAIYFVGGAGALRRINRIIGSKDMEDAEERRYLLTEEGIRYTGKHGSGEAKWRDIAEIADTNDHIFVFANGQLPYVLPRRAFRSEQEAVQFIRLARDYHDKAFEAPQED